MSFSLNKLNIVNMICRYFLGAPEKLARNDKSCFQCVLLDDEAESYLLTQLSKMAKFSDFFGPIVVISPYRETNTINKIVGLCENEIISVTPHCLNEVVPITKKTLDILNPALVVCINLSQLPLLNQTISFVYHDALLYEMAFSQCLVALKRKVSGKGLSLIMLDNVHNISQKNSALIERLSLGNTVFIS